jgi:hypothetical protein
MSERMCGGNCDECMESDGMRVAYQILNKLVEMGVEEVEEVTNEICCNLTVCPDCRIDDFCHIDDEECRFSG